MYGSRQGCNVPFLFFFLQYDNFLIMGKGTGRNVIYGCMKENAIAAIALNSAHN